MKQQTLLPLHFIRQFENGSRELALSMSSVFDALWQRQLHCFASANGQVNGASDLECLTRFCGGDVGARLSCGEVIEPGVCLVAKRFQ